MIYGPQIDAADPRQRAALDDLLDAARRLDGLAPVRRDPRAARPLLLGLRRRPRLRRRRRPAARLGPRVDQVRRGLHAHARDRRRAARPTGPTEEEVERARAYAAGRRVLAFENTNAVARHAASQTVVFGEDIDPDAAIAALDAVTFDEVARGRARHRRGAGCGLRRTARGRRVHLSSRIIPPPGCFPQWCGRRISPDVVPRCVLVPGRAAEHTTKKEAPPEAASDPAARDQRLPRAPRPHAVRHGHADRGPGRPVPGRRRRVPRDAHPHAAPPQPAHAAGRGRRPGRRQPLLSSLFHDEPPSRS